MPAVIPTVRLYNSRVSAADLPPAPHPTEEAILRTLLYSDVFDYPLTPAEVHHYLIGLTTSVEVVQHTLDTSAWLAAHVTRVNGYVMLQGREPIGTVRAARAHSSARLWPAARQWAFWIGCLPFVRMVAVTGALAMNNAPNGDDIDYLIVTTPGRIWFARALIIALVRFARLFGVGLCPNYLLAQTALVQPQQNLFIAHDLAQMVPLMGLEVYAEMLAHNRWATNYLPQATGPWQVEPDLAPKGLWAALKRLGEYVFRGWLGEQLETWERRRKVHKFSVAVQQAGAEVQMDAEHVKGHFHEHGRAILQKFADRLARFFPPS